MNTVRLIYASKFASGTGTPEIEDILRASRKHNVEKKITGLLCYAPGLFLQCLEGPREAVNNLYRTIARDERHQDLTVLEYSDIAERQFGEWSMAYVRVEDLDSDVSKFNPYGMTAPQALEFVSSIAEKRKELLDGAVHDAE